MVDSVSPAMPVGTHLQTLAVEAFAFGCVNSLHCVGMCGPLSAFFLERPSAAVAYHGGRALSYATVGALAGTIGLALGAGRWALGGAWFAFALALALLLMAFGFERVLGRIPGLGRAVTGITSRLRSYPVIPRALLLGMATPLLPCGLLYAACGAAIAAGGPLEGAVSMTAFALGAVPLLLAAQWNLVRLTQRLGPARMRTVARAAMVIAAALLVWRGAIDLAARSAGADGACPACVTGS